MNQVIYQLNYFSKQSQDRFIVIFLQNSFVFFNSEQFPAIAQNLDLKKSDQVRLRAMQQLLSIPAGDPQAADHWIEIRKYMLVSLKDPNEKIAVKNVCLRILTVKI